jgi:hypothetical protein
MKRNLVKAAACAGVAAAVALIGWTPGSGHSAGAVTSGPPSVVVKLPATGTGLNSGKDVRVRVNITCANASPGPITVHVNQKRGSRTIHGVGTSKADYRCNGRTQHEAVLVHATRGFFVPGAASATADVQVCNSANSCQSGHDARDIDLVKPRNTTTTSEATTTVVSQP